MIAGAPGPPAERPPEKRWSLPLRLAATLPAAVVPFLVRVTAWPEVIVPAYFMARGGVLYETIFFPHTPLLLTALAAAGAVFGFSALLLRAVISAGMVATALLIVSEPRRERGFPTAAVAGVVLAIFWQSYLEGVAVWPDPLLAPILLAAALLLEGFEATGSRYSLRAAGFLLGLAILVKQTSAWVAVAALLWMVLSRKSIRQIAALGLMIAAPYAAFAVLWGVVYRTTTHLYWTLVLPVFSSHAREIRWGQTWDDVHESIAPFLTLPALLLLNVALRQRRRTPCFLMSLGVAGMAWPRGGLLHLSASTGLISLLGGRAVQGTAEFFRLWRRERLPPARLAPAVGGIFLLISAAAVAVWSGGSRLADDRHGGVLFWDDTFASDLLQRVRAKVLPGGRLFLYNTTRDNLYVRSQTLTPDGLYVNSSFWYYFNKAGLDERITRGLAAFPGWILFRDVSPSETELRKTALHQFLTRNTVIRERVGGDMSWRVVSKPAP